MKTPPIIGIYKITSPTGRIYIGQSRNIKKRFTSYKSLSKKNKGQPKIYASLLKHGANNHAFEIIEECAFEDMNIRERFWQEFYNSCSRDNLNCTLTETDFAPRQISQETRNKFSLNAKERMKNLVKDSEFMAKMKANGLKRKGVKLPERSQQTKERNRIASIKNKSFKGENNYWFNKPRFGSDNPNFGITLSDETKSKISIANTGKLHSKETKKLMSNQRIMRGNVKAKLVLNLETGIYYECGKEAWLSINHYAWTTLRCKMNGNAKNTTSFIYV